MLAIDKDDVYRRYNSCTKSVKEGIAIRNVQFLKKSVVWE